MFSHGKHPRKLSDSSIMSSDSRSSVFESNLHISAMPRNSLDPNTALNPQFRKIPMLKDLPTRLQQTMSMDADLGGTSLQSIAIMENDIMKDEVIFASTRNSTAQIPMTTQLRAISGIPSGSRRQSQTLSVTKDYRIDASIDEEETPSSPKLKQDKAAGPVPRKETLINSVPQSPHSVIPVNFSTTNSGGRHTPKGFGNGSSHSKAGSVFNISSVRDLTERAIENIPAQVKLMKTVLGTPISHKSKNLAYWCFILDIFHCVLLILIPIQLAWTTYFTNPAWTAFYLAMDAIMILDCWVQARVDYTDEYGQLITTTEAICLRYLFHLNGILEVFSSMPWELLQYLVYDGSDLFVLQQYLGPYEGSDPVQFYRMKVWAMILFIKIFLRAPYTRIYQIHIPHLALPISRLVKCMVILMFIGHIDACLFWFIDYTLPEGNRWIDINTLIVNPRTSLPVPFSTQYLISYLAALRSLVLKLRDAEIDTENIYIIFEFVAGILSYGTVFGNIHSILELLDSTAAINQAEEYHNFEMQGIVSFMKEKKISPRLQKMVKDYKELQWHKSKGLDEDHFFVGIPKAIQQEIKNFLYLDLVSKMPLFQDVDFYFQQILAFKIKPMHVLNGWTIFRKGDEGEEMYFIKSGTVEICSEAGDIVFTTLTAGGFFGEIALFESCHRTATARAKGDCELCILLKEDFEILMNMYPVVAEGIRETIRLRKLGEEEKKKKFAAAAQEEAERAEIHKNSLQLSRAGKRFSISIPRVHSGTRSTSRRASMQPVLAGLAETHPAGSGSHSSGLGAVGQLLGADELAGFVAPNPGEYDIAFETTKDILKRENSERILRNMSFKRRPSMQPF